MTSVIKYYEGIDSVAVIGNYLPRQCGIATFTTDLVEALSLEAPDIHCWAAAMNDNTEGYAYPEKCALRSIRTSCPTIVSQRNSSISVRRILSACSMNTDFSEELPAAIC